MHKLVDYICDELEELERKVDNDGKLSMAEIQYMDTLAHAKKNLLKSDEMAEEEYSSMSYRYDDGRSMARGRTGNVRRDARGRYSRRRDYSYGEQEMHNLVDSIHDVMNDLPEDTKRDAQKFIKKLEQSM